MVKRQRERLDDEEAPVRRGAYFEEDAPPRGFIHSGSTRLDHILGGGWALGRMSNVVGDKSTAKTGVAIEACANFARQFPNGKIFYREAEAAFDINYAERLGLPVERVEFAPPGSFRTVEDLSRDLRDICKAFADKNTEALYITDSVDALSSEAELAREVGEGSYSTEKAKGLSEMFRQRIQSISECKIHTMFISQIRDNIGVTFGKKYSRSGGHAMDFYASQVIYLAKASDIKKTVDKVERIVGVDIKAKCDKNKIRSPHLTCDFPVMFSYGIDDLRSCVEYLYEVGELSRVYDKVDSKTAINTYMAMCNRLENDAYFARVAEVSAITAQVDREIDKKFEPQRSKYG